ncbi:MAG TPA: YbaB/EbfC family nucleoid-associated protein [Caulobacteraceae bacterium]|jgi:DNA-binding YbaB/EbfC family protein|nr:YbaB/EbfC family nucleoid-associated protein [Caulobacteraceae bacterium]
MKDLNSIMKQAQAMQQKLQEAQGRLALTTVEGAAGAGLVKLVLTGAGEMKAVAIDPSLLAEGDSETLGDLIVAAHADAKRRIDEAQADLMRQTMGPLAGALPGIPGLKF